MVLNESVGFVLIYRPHPVMLIYVLLVPPPSPLVRKVTLRTRSPHPPYPYSTSFQCCVGCGRGLSSTFAYRGSLDWHNYHCLTKNFIWFGYSACLSQ
jgi:hypothetical protein